MVIKPKVATGAVKADIEAALRRVTQLEAKKISVSVDADVVTLSGTVGSWSERDLATTTAWATPGVRSVVDNMALAY
jgi:osmotically-inducible protein OsmY